MLFAVATRGGRGWVWPFRNILEWLRERHQRRAAGILGCAEVVFLGYPDGSVREHGEELARDLRSLIESRRPDVVLCWDPDYNVNPHRDHQAAAEATRTACAAVTNCWYGTWEPNLWVGFDEDTMRAKIRALKAHRTETPWFYFDVQAQEAADRGDARRGIKDRLRVRRDVQAYSTTSTDAALSTSSFQSPLTSTLSPFLSSLKRRLEPFRVTAASRASIFVSLRPASSVRSRLV